MKLQVRSIVLLLPLLLTGCVPKNKQAQTQPPLAPPIEDTPLPKPDNAPANLPPPVITVPQPKSEPSPATASKPEPPPAPPKQRRKPSPSKPAPSQPPAQPTEQASNSVPEVSAGGGFSAGEGGDKRNQTQISIVETEHSLNGITRKLNDQEQKTSAQIREFLKQAKTALAAGDVDGAQTLATKAKVLLGELSQ